MPKGFSTVCLMFLLAGVACNSYAEAPAAGPIAIKADSLSHEAGNDIFRASGEVEITWDAARLTADNAMLNQKSGDAVAEGNVRLLRGSDLLKSDRISINMFTEQGEVLNGDLFVEKANLHVRGNKMARTGEGGYLMEEGSFTTCDGEVPSWKFTASDLEVTLEEYAVGRNSVFYIRNFPIFYTPYIVFPVKLERQSGFLFPRLGSSTRKGFYLDIPYYWAISPSMDLTVDLDIQTKRGVGTGAEYRYVRREGSDGEFRGYGIYDTEQQKFRGDLEGKARDRIGPGLDAKADVSLVTDRTFYRDFAVDTGEYNRQLLDSSVSLAKTWENAALTGQLRYVQDLYAPNDRLTLQRLPEMSYTLLSRRLGRLPAFASLDSAFTSFYREEGQTGQRLAVHPKLQVYLPVWEGGITAWGGYNQRFYTAMGEEDRNGLRGVGNADAGAAFTATGSRVYDVGWGNLRKMKHTLIPEVGYRFIETRDQESLPLFDLRDRVPGESTVYWSISNFLTGKAVGGEEDYRDLLWLRLSQGVLLDGTRRDLVTLTDDGRRFSDLRLELRSNPVKSVSVSTDSRFDPYDLHFSTSSVSADIDDGRGNIAGLGYHMSRGVVDYLEGRLAANVVKPFLFNYTGRYSFDRGEFLEALYSVEYKQQCWSLTFSFRDRPDNREFLVSFNLAGIGGPGALRAF